MLFFANICYGIPRMLRATPTRSGPAAGTRKHELWNQNFLDRLAVYMIVVMARIAEEQPLFLSS